MGGVGVGCCSWRVVVFCWVRWREWLARAVAGATLLEWVVADEGMWLTFVCYL